MTDRSDYRRWADKSCLAWNSQGGDCYYGDRCRCAAENRPSLFQRLWGWLR